MRTSSVGEARVVSSGRRIAFSALCVLLAAVIGLFAWPGLIGGWFEGGDRLIHRVHDIGWGALGGIALAGGFLSQVGSPERRIAGLQMAALVGVAFLAAVIATEWAGLVFLPIVAVPVAIVAALHPARGRFLRAGAGFSPLLAGIAAIGAVPLVWFALSQASIQRNGIGDQSHLDELHWVSMAALALAIVLLGGLASLKTPGWRIPAWSAGAMIAVYGLSSVLFPHYPSGEGVGWGLAAMAGGLLFGVAAEWEAWRERLAARS